MGTITALIALLTVVLVASNVRRITKRTNQIDRDVAHLMAWYETTQKNTNNVENEAARVTLQNTGVDDSKAHKATQLALKHGWALLDVQSNIKLVRFMRATAGDVIKINIYYGSKRGKTLYTVATALNHPKQGKTQLFRQDITTEELEAILQNPREHTKKGYYTKNARTWN